MSKFGYQNNPNLPRAGYQHSFTQHEKNEFIKCAFDPVYFACTYVKIVNVDHGLMNFDMWPFQKDMLEKFHKNRFSICKMPRQCGKTSTAVAHLLHTILFNEDFRIAILANKASTAREIMSRLQLAFEYLPLFLKQGVVEWNKGSIVFANGSTAQADSTTGGSVRGKTFNIILLDEFAHVPNNIAETFFMSTYPTITSGKTTKVIIVSTPNGAGMNLFYRMWNEAIQKKSLYVPIEAHWSMVPGRDEAWKAETIQNTSLEQFRQEFEAEFVGSTNTLINPSKLGSFVVKQPLSQIDNLDVYKEPEKNNVYCITVDVAEGQGLDYSAFSVFDVSQLPYRHVAKYHNNEITPMLLPTKVVQVAQQYNDAFVLVEINSIGLQVADIIHFELAYEHLIKIETKGKQGQHYTPGFKKKIAFGLRTTVQTKMIGCNNLKTLIESDKLITHDKDTIDELTTFSASGNSFKAEGGNNDDLAMTLVHFGWLTGQKFFKESIGSNIRKALQEEQLNIMDQDLVPFGLIDNGIDPIERAAEQYEDSKEKWIVQRDGINVFDNMEFDILTNRHRM